MYKSSMYYGHLHVYPQELTPAASRVEKTLRDYKKELNPPYFVKGQVDHCCPSVQISAGGLGNAVLEHPYTGIEDLYDQAEQSQVGTATETLFVFDARKSKEFSDIVVLNDAWKDKVTAVCDRVKQVLAPGAKKVNADLYKLLIYSKGDFFNCHQDAQHSARMFATLLFFLPVRYTGGEFEVFERGNWDDIHVIQDKKIPGSCSWVAFYTDVRHRVSEVEEGFRVVLNYSLSFDGAMAPSSFLPSSCESAMVDYFKTIGKKCSLAIPLSYQYTLATLSPDFLKGLDAYVFRAIETLAVAELHYVIRFDKTKVITYDDYRESDHKQIFQCIFLVDRVLAKQYFDIAKEMEGKKMDEKRRDKVCKKYMALLEEVKTSQQDFDLEWIVERKSGNPTDYFSQLNFEHGNSIGWLGNMTPAEEYYYLKAAIVVRRLK